MREIDNILIDRTVKNPNYFCSFIDFTSLQIITSLTPELSNIKHDINMTII